MERIDIIGTIATEGELWRLHEGSKQTVFINGNKQLQYSVQTLMTLGDTYKNVKFFTGYLNNLEKYGFKESSCEDSYGRAEAFKEMIENYLFIFNPIEVSGGHMRMDNVAIIIKPRGYEEGMTFESIPFYRTRESIESFVQGWQKHKCLGCSEAINKTKDIPFILWQPLNTTKVYCIGTGNKVVCYQERLYATEDVTTYELTPEEAQRVILNPRYNTQELAFVETSLCDSLAYEIGQHHSPRLVVTQQADVIKEQCSQEILSQLYAIISKSGFTYVKQDLVNFHTSLKTKSLVILEGMSGTGKSRLVDFYRQALGLDDKHYKCISVKASWTDESDLLGYPDMMNNCYRPDHEGVVDLLLDAEKHPEELYLLCFDEMNLARVEHYFSQFLSILEMEQSQQVLRLYNNTLDLSNKKDYPATIAFKGNILFVGTINKDESTHHFSDKVLDRANVIKLGGGSLKDLYKQVEIKGENHAVATTRWTTTAYFGETMKLRQVILSERELEMLDEVHQMLTAGQYDKGIGYRIVRQIEEYIYKLPINQIDLTREEAFDLQFTQRILSKLRGDRMSLEGILIEEDEDSMPLMACLEKYADICEFKSSKKMILQKVKALKCYGYTM